MQWPIHLFSCGPEEDQISSGRGFNPWGCGGGQCGHSGQLQISEEYWLTRKWTGLRTPRTFMDYGLSRLNIPRRLKSLNSCCCECLMGLWFPAPSRLLWCAGATDWGGHMTSSLVSENGAFWLDQGGIFFCKQSKRKKRTFVDGRQELLPCFECYPPNTSFPPSSSSQWGLAGRHFTRFTHVISFH